MVTILQVAREAGVSVATVSRVINQSGVVKEKTAKRVLDSIERLGYMPNLQARNLRKNESGTILVLLPNITNNYYACIFDGINEQARELGYNLFLCNTQGRKQEEILKNVIAQKQADGAILLALNREEDWLEGCCQQFPIVQCCEYAENCSAPSVSIDNYQVGYEATRYLIETGHKKIGMISSTNKFCSTQQREEGYRDALKNADLERNCHWTVYADDSYSYSSALKAARKLLSMKELPDALFCIGDEPAFGAVITAGELGICIPEELSVIGVDDVKYTTMVHPYLTTMAQPCAELGRTALKMLLALIKGEHLENKKVTLPYKFIERESTSRKNK